MAQTLKLVRKNDFVSDVDSLDLLAFASGISVQREGFIPSFDGGSEVITLTVKGTSRDNLAANLQVLETKLQQIKDFLVSSVEPYYVVLRDQAPGETSARDNLVTGFSVKLGSSLHQANLFVQEYRLALDRVGPAWEDSSATTKTYSALSFYGPSSSTNTLGGVVPGRIGRLTVKGISGKGTIEELWAGFRTARFGSLTNFVGLWEAEKCTDGTDTSGNSISGLDATATPGGDTINKTVCTFGTVTTLVQRFTLTAYQISNSYYANLRGTFDIIARMNVSAGVTANVRLDSGIHNGTSFVPMQIGDLVTVSSTAWKYYNLGRITWPPLSRATSNLSAIKNACLAMYAERTAGSDNWYVDHFIPIPVDEGILHLDDLSVAYATNDTNQRAEVYADALGNVEAVQYGSGDVVGKVDTRGIHYNGFSMPSAEAKIVVAAQTASPAITDQLTVVVEAFKRYQTLRGAA